MFKIRFDSCSTMRVQMELAECETVFLRDTLMIHVMINLPDYGSELKKYVSTGRAFHAKGGGLFRWCSSN